VTEGGPLVLNGWKKDVGEIAGLVSVDEVRDGKRNGAERNEGVAYSPTSTY